MGKKYVIPDSGGHMMGDLRAVAGDIKYTTHDDIKEYRSRLKDVCRVRKNALKSTISVRLLQMVCPRQTIALDSEQSLVAASGLSTISGATVT